MEEGEIMHTGTGEIISRLEYEAKVNQGDNTARFYKLIPESLLPELMGMNRKQRREWYRNNKHRFKETP
jgi:hypothetical protein